MRYVLTPTQEKELRKLAAKLPVQMYVFRDRVTMTGAELKLTPAGTPDMEDDKEYTLTMPGYNQVNHFRRLKRIYSKEGVDGVVRYCAPLLKLKMQEHKKL